MLSKIRVRVAKIVAVMLVLTAIGVQGQQAFALSLTSLSDNMSRLKASTASNHDIRFVTPVGGGLASTETLTVTFSSDFVPGSVAFGDIDLQEGNSNNCSTASFSDKTLVASGPSSSQFSAAFSSNVLTFTSGGASATITADRCIRILIGTNAAGGTNQITNGAADDDDTIAIAGTWGDTGTISVDIITDDQVSVTATVDPSITFSISDNTIGFGTLSAADDRFATGDTLGSSSATVAHTLAAGTNATSGYTMYVSGATLTSGLNTINSIGASATASTLGTEQFGLKLSGSGGSGAAVSPYNTANYAYNATGSTQDDIAAATGATATTTYDVTYVANIASNTEAGSYSTTLTYTATATFQERAVKYSIIAILLSSFLNLSVRILQSFSIVNIKRFRSAIILAGSLFLFFLTSSLASALTIIPPRLELDGDPGVTVNSDFKVLNETNETQIYYTQVENFEAKDETGSPQFVQTREGLAIWTSVASSITVAPGERKTVPFSIRIPKNAEPGGYFASIFVRTTPPSVNGGEVSIGARLGTLVLLRVNGEIQEGVDILEFSSTEKKRLFTSLPIEFYYRFQNTGADRVKPTGDVVVKNIFQLTAKVLSANRTEGSVLPRSIRRFEMAWIHGGGGQEDSAAEVSERTAGGFFSEAKYQWSNFALGMYTAKLDIAFGENGNTAASSYSFFVFPWQLLTIIIVVLAIIFIVLRFALRRYNRYIIKRHQVR